MSPSRLIRCAVRISGPSHKDRDVRALLDAKGARYHAFDSEPALLRRVTDLLAEEKVIGWMQGRMEFGPRALGARSIIGDPRSTKMQQIMNLKIKFREGFRPFAPSVLRERSHDYFDVPHDHDSPYMLLVAPVQHDKRAPGSAEQMQGLAGIERAQRHPLGRAVDYARRFLGAHPDRDALRLTVATTG